MPFHKKIFRGVKKLVDSVVDAVTDVAKAAVDIVASPFKMPSMGDFGGFDATAGQVDNDILGPLLNKDSGVGNLPVIYGQRRVGGYRVFVSTNGTDNKYLYVALAICEGQVDSIDKIYIDDTEVPMSSYAHGVQATPSSGDYSDRLVTQFFDGRDDQTVSSLLDAAPGWGSNHRLRGVAYLACRFEWKKIESQEDADNNPYRSGVPKIQVRIKGRKVFNVLAGYSPTAFGTLSTDDTDGGYTTNGDNTIATKSANLSVVSTGGVTLDNNDNNNNIRINTPPTGAAVKVVIDTEVSSNTNNYGQVGYGVRLQEDNNNVDLESTLNYVQPTNVAVRQVDGTVRKTFSFVVKNFSSSSNYRIKPFVNVAATGGGTISGTYTTTIEVQKPQVETHTTAYASETEVYSTNPINVLIDYLRNPRYGKGLSNDYFDWASFRLAASQCDQTVPYTTSTTGKFNEFDGIIDTAQSLLNNVKNILASFNGIMPYQAGKYHVKLHHGGDPTDMDSAPNPPPVVMTIDEDVLIGGLRIQGESKQRKINQLRVTYTDPDADYQPNDAFWPETSSSVYSTYLTEDNNIPLHKQIALPHCIHRERALNFAETVVKASRNKMMVQFSTTTAATDVSVGDLVRIVNNNLNFDGYFRIEAVSLSGEGSLNFTATEHNPNDYVLDGHAAAAAKPTINLPNPLQVIAPTNLAVSQSTTLSGSGYTATEQLDITWTASTDVFTTEYIVQVKPAADSDFYTVGITNDTEFFWGPVATGDQWDVRVAARNELDRRSDYATVATYTVT
jgi:hypothetical protein